MSLTWISNNGTTWPLDGSLGVTVVDDDDGIFTPFVDLVIDQRVGDGGVLVTSRRSPQRVVLSFMVDDDSGNVRALWRQFLAALAAGGTLQYTRVDATTCDLTSVVLEGPDRSMTGRDLQYHGTDRFRVSLIALDPWWYGPMSSVSGLFDTPTPWNAALPWNSAIPWNGGAATSVNNSGDAPAWCTVVVTGAADQVSMSIDGVGGWETAVTIGSGEYLSVSSQPGRKGPHRGPHGFYAGADDAVDWSLLTEWSNLFELPVGVSSLVFGASGTDGSSAWELHWAERYLTP